MFPARAGVIPVAASAFIPVSGVPRASGGDPCGGSRQTLHTWVFPARAGVILLSLSGEVCKLQWMPFEDFDKSPPLPANVNEYLEYRKKVLAFVRMRDARIEKWVAKTKSS